MVRYDLVIRDGILADPVKMTMTPGNIGVKAGRIVAITSWDIQGKKEIDARGHVVCPGFIDVHGHIDGHRQCANLAMIQGITTTVGGNCGLSPLNLKEFFDTQDQNGFPIHQAQLIGHSFSLRERVGLTDPYSPASATQIHQMVQLAEQAFLNGAIGLSFGLEYAPGSSFEEIIALSRIAARYGRLIPIHTRMLGCGDLASLDEAVRIAELTRTRVLVSHFVYQYGCGLSPQALAMVDQARQKALDVRVDSGMYTAFASFIGTPIFSQKCMAEFGWQPENLMAVTGKYCGQCLSQKLYEEMRQNHPGESVICFTGNEAEIYEPFTKDYTMVSSDIGPTPNGSTQEGHPQNTGTFPRFFRKLVRERRQLSLIQAVAKCTLLPADTLGLPLKGRLSEGADADLVILDIDRIMDRADFPGLGSPDTPPEGIEFVIVNGQVVVENSRIIKGVLPGKSIRISSVNSPSWPHAS